MVVVWRRRSKEEKIKAGTEGRAGAAGREGGMAEGGFNLVQCEREALGGKNRKTEKKRRRRSKHRQLRRSEERAPAKMGTKEKEK